LIDDVESDIPSAIKTGDQIWMKYNLNVSKFSSGDDILRVSTAEEWEEAGQKKLFTFFYDNDSSNGELFGKLYNWIEVSDPRGIAPKGWQIPKDQDLQKMADFL
jgi:uncharacterized protein (TIGR02145 family)